MTNDPHNPNNYSEPHLEPLLTKREYFAAMAMQGLLSNSGHVQTFSGNNPNPVPEYVSEISVGIADALIKALNQ